MSDSKECMRKMTLDELIKDMISRGWTLDALTNEQAQFSLYEDAEHVWFRDYDIKTLSFVHYNSRQKINLVSTPRKESDE